MMRSFCYLLIVLAGVALAVFFYGDRIWLSRFHLGTYVQSLPAEFGNQPPPEVVARGLITALHRCGLDTNVWRAESMPDPRRFLTNNHKGIIITLTNHLMPYRYIFVQVRSVQAGIEYSVYRSE